MRKASPALRPYCGRAPHPSPALIALQDRGLELSRQQSTPSSISPQSNPANDIGFRASPLSIVSTPPALRPTQAVNERELILASTLERRRSSIDSGEITVTNILNLYINRSEQSLKSDYEDITPYPESDTGDDEEGMPPLQLLHQPKAQAYRDTIMPLLEYQFSTSSLKLPAPVPSPMSLASMPTLMQPSVNESVLSLHLSPSTSPNLGIVDRKAAKVGAGVSESSIQITPEMSPPSLLPSDSPSSPGMRARKINLEVPDVREAESWYDQPLSPISPEDLKFRNAVRDSQQSAISPQSIDSARPSTKYFRALALGSLSPPTNLLRTGPDLRGANTVASNYVKTLALSSLDRNRSPSLISRGSTPAHHTEIVENVEERETKSQHTSLVAHEGGTIQDDPFEVLKQSQPTTTTATARILSNNHTENTDPSELYRRGSTFSSSSDSFVIYDTIGGQMKAIFREQFGRKDKKKKKVDKQKELVIAGKQRDRGSAAAGVVKEVAHGTGRRERRVPIPTRNAVTAFTDDAESYKYPYGLGQPFRSGTAMVGPAYEIGTPKDADSQRDQIMEFDSDCSRQRRRDPSTVSITESATDTSSSSHIPSRAQIESRNTDMSSELTRQPTNITSPSEPYLAVPLSKYQRYGIENWYESNKKKRRKEREKRKREWEKAEKIASIQQAKVIADQMKSESLVENTSDDPPSSGPRPSSDKSKSGFYRQLGRHAHKKSDGPSASSVSSIRLVQRNTGMTVGQESIDSERHDQSQQASLQLPLSRDSGGQPAATNTEKGSDAALSSYNNDLFEASGGRKKAGLASRLMMSTEEKRRKKVKESIMILGGAKMGEGSGPVKI